MQSAGTFIRQPLPIPSPPSQCALLLKQAIPGGGGPGTFVMRRPAMAFGCSDGVVRVVQFGSFQVCVHNEPGALN